MADLTAGMTDVLKRNWWTFALRGVIAIIFGVVAWIWPGLTLLSLIYLFAAYSLIDGVTALISIFTRGGSGRWVWLLLEGVLGIGAAIVAIAWPGLTALTFVYIIGAWAVIIGVLRIISAVRLRQEIDNEWWMGLSGLASIVFGIILFVAPGAGILSLLWLLGVWAIIFGVFEIMLAFRLRSMNTTDTTAAAA